MYSELECGICYRTYNAGRRCPRELHCKHSFCESCLLALSRAPGAAEPHPGDDRFIVCPLCRQTTSISIEGEMRAELRVDECVLERLLAAGVLYLEEEEDVHPGVELDSQVQDSCYDELASLPEIPADESDSAAGSGGGRVRRSWKNVWRKISGKSSRQSRRESNCITNDDLRHFAMMSCYMF